MSYENLGHRYEVEWSNVLKLPPREVVLLRWVSQVGGCLCNSSTCSIEEWEGVYGYQTICTAALGGGSYRCGSARIKAFLVIGVAGKFKARQ